MIHMKDLKPVSRSERVLFHCQKCGGCCRYVKDGVMLEPMDAYNLARHLRDQGDSVTGTDGVLARFAHAAWLDDSLPIFLLNAFGPYDACVFLKEGQCSVYEARPRVCRLYPFTVAPGSRGRDFQYFLCTEKDHHFSDGAVIVDDWLSQYFPKTARNALKADFDALPILGQNIRAMGSEQFKRLAFQFIYYRYYNYELDKPFLPQFLNNLAKLKELVGQADT